MFDASKVNMLIEAILGRFLNDDDMPTMICIGVAAVPRSVNAESQQALLRRHISTVGIAMRDIVGAISDSGPPNPTCMTNWNVAASEVYFGDELQDEKLLWEPCMMHGMSNCGIVIRKRLPLVKLFMSGYKTMFHTSDAACKIWLDITKTSAPSLSEKTFWAWWNCANAIVQVWALVPSFLMVANQRGVCKKSIQKMKLAFSSPPALRAEMDFALMVG
jgi:hypothetical protein